MSDKNKLKEFPVFKSDEEAERFVDEADLSEYDFSGFQPMRFEFHPKTANISMRVPQQLLDAVKEQALREGIPYQRFIRQTLERAITARK
jgi:predicted DNA binding CopG/RHH family protein